MKPYLAALCVVCAMFLPSFGYAQYGDMYLRFLEGDVQVRTEDTLEWLPASINMPLINGDHIWVPDNGKAELMLRNGTVVRLDRNSYLEILSTEEGRSRFYLVTGNAYAYTKLDTSDAVIFETSRVSFYTYGRSIVRIDTSEEEDYTAASVFQGTVYAYGNTGQTKINPGNRIIFYKDDSYPRFVAIPPPDRWEQWNRLRDRELGLASSAPSRSYLPEELSAYHYDFERYGRWVYEPEYGYVWIPTAIVARDWSPYRMGRWVWMRGDYVWISYEPWGWVPHHFGRWAYIIGRGWCWVPPVKGAVYWGPGFVGWIRTPTYISWVPLAPRETYYGYGNYGPHSVNVRNTNFRVSPTYNNTYRNIHVHNAVIVLHLDAFMTGRPTTNRVIHDNPFLKERYVMAPPNIKPERPAVMPVIKDIPQAKMPPQHIISRTSVPRSTNSNLEAVRVQENTVKETTPRHPVQISVTNIPEKSTPSINMRNLPTNGTNSQPVTVPVQVQSPGKEGSTARFRNFSPQNTVKEGTASRQSPPNLPANIQERKIETHRKITEIPAINPQVKMEIQQRQTPQHVANIQYTTPPPSNIQPAISQPPPQQRKTENTQTDQKIEQNTQTNTSVSMPSEQNRNNFRKDFRTGMRPGRHNIMSPN